MRLNGTDMKKKKTSSRFTKKIKQKINSVFAVRDSLLSQSDWVVIREREEGGSVSNFTDWKKYRQELRDITKTYKSLDDVK